jgi:hypothetical protein
MHEAGGGRYEVRRRRWETRDWRSEIGDRRRQEVGGRMVFSVGWAGFGGYPGGRRRGTGGAVGGRRSGGMGDGGGKCLRDKRYKVGGRRLGGGDRT